MKQSRILIFVLAIALVIMGAGYAAWSQEFTVNATVDTGELSVIVHDFGEDTEINYLSIINNDGSVYDHHKMDHNDITGDDLTGWTLIPSNGSDFQYVTMSMYLPADKKSIDFNLSSAYPGLKSEFAVEVLNDGTVPVELETDQPAVFKGAGLNPELAQYLLNNNYVEFTIDPNTDYAPDGYRIEPTTTFPFNVTMEIMHDLPEIIELNGLDVEVEGANLTFELMLIANQDI